MKRKRKNAEMFEKRQFFNKCCRNLYKYILKRYSEFICQSLWNFDIKWKENVNILEYFILVSLALTYILLEISPYIL